MSFDDVEVGDRIVFRLPHGTHEGDKVTGGVGEIVNGELVVKAGGYYHVSPEGFVGIDEKDAF